MAVDKKPENDPNQLRLDADSTYGQTSDEWKEYVHTRSHYVHRRTRVLMRVDVTEFEDMRSSASSEIARVQAKIERTELPPKALAALNAWEHSGRK